MQIFLKYILVLNCSNSS